VEIDDALDTLEMYYQQRRLDEISLKQLERLDVLGALFGRLLQDRCSTIIDEWHNKENRR